MQHIAIYETDSNSIRTITNLIYSLPHAQDLIKIHPFSRVDKLLEQCKKGTRYSLVILVSHELPHKGLEYATTIRFYDSEVPIYLVSAFIRDALDGFHLLDQFYLFPYAPKKLLRDVKEQLRTTRFSQDRIIRVRNIGGIHNIPAKEILYFESNDGQLTIKLKDQVLDCRGSIHLLDNAINRYDFFRTHKSYLVNLHQVRDVIGMQIFMMNGDFIPLAKQRSPQFRAALWNLEGKELIYKI